MVKAFFSRAKLLNSFEIYLLLGILFHSLTPNLSMGFLALPLCLLLIWPVSRCQTGRLGLQNGLFWKLI